MGGCKSVKLLYHHGKHLGEKLLKSQNTENSDLIDILLEETSRPTIPWTKLEKSKYYEALRNFGKDHEKI